MDLEGAMRQACANNKRRGEGHRDAEFSVSFVYIYRLALALRWPVKKHDFNESACQEWILDGKS